MEMMKRVLALLLVFAMLMPNLTTIAQAADTEESVAVSTEPVVIAEEPETEETSHTTAETIGPIGLGRIPADDVVIETKTTEVATEPDRSEPEVTTEPDATIPEENPTGEEMQPATQPSEETYTDNGPNWGGGRA